MSNEAIPLYMALYLTVLDPVAPDPTAQSFTCPAVPTPAIIHPTGTLPVAPLRFSWNGTPNSQRAYVFSARHLAGPGVVLTFGSSFSGDCDQHGNCEFRLLVPFAASGSTWGWSVQQHSPEDVCPPGPAASATFSVQ